MLLVDFETRSRCDLIAAGTYAYASDPSTDVLCCAFLPLDQNDPREWIWSPAEGALPDDLIAAIESADYIMAHNAQFDRLIWKHVAERLYAFPHVPLDRWYCTSAQMRINNLPAALENAAIALDNRFRKDAVGKTLIAKLSKPQKDGTFNADPELLSQMRAYCLQDARVTRELVNATRLLTTREQRDWVESERINDRGVLIDRDLAESAMRYRESETHAFNHVLARVTDGAIQTVGQSKAAARWVVNMLGEAHPVTAYMKKINDAGEMHYSLDKNIRQDVLEAVASDALDLPLSVIEAIETIEQATFTSVAKFQKMTQRLSDGDRFRGAFIFAGASTTQRFSSSGPQLMNLPRAAFETLDETWSAYEQVLAHEPIADAMETLKKLLRHAIMAPDDHWLVVSDWTGVEARVLPWLADCPPAHAKLNQLASGLDVYEQTARDIGMEGRRAIGKVAELACGYGGGMGAFKQFARAFRVTLDDNTIAAIIKRWRIANAWVVEFWRDLVKSAGRAVSRPGTIVPCRRVQYVYNAELMGGTLWCILPDETVLSYPNCRFELDNRGWRQLTCLNASVKKRQADRDWPRMKLYGGQLAGHVTQATAGALLRDALRELEDERVVMHVHDEIIVECHEDALTETFKRVKDVMNTSPDWAEGLPLDATPVVMERYRKD